MDTTWEVIAWADYSADWGGKILLKRTFKVTKDQAEHVAGGAYEVALKWPPEHMLAPDVVSLRQIHPPIPPIGSQS